MRTAGFVLVGGRSARMGRDKALLPWRNETLAESIAGRVREAAGNVCLVGRPERCGFAPTECLPDLRPGLGPLSGIETALASGRGDLNLIVACDMPLIEAEWLKAIIQDAQNRDSRCLIASDEGGRLHPLCGVYRSDCLPVIRKAIDSGRLKLMEIIEELGADLVSVEARIWNVNTPEEWQLCQEFANGR